jgi:hypothetical protein
MRQSIFRKSRLLESGTLGTAVRKSIAIEPSAERRVVLVATDATHRAVQLDA